STIGIKSLDKILEIYMYAFAGLKTELQAADEPLAESLAHRITDFYSISIKPLRRLYVSLKRAGIFTDFQEEFCSMPGLPSLLSQHALSELEAGGVMDYCRRLYRRGFHEVGKLTPSHLERVKYRRALQTRAYFSFQLRHLMKHEWVLPAKRFKVLKPKLISGI